MKKTIRVISLMLCLVMLLGCVTVLAEDDYYKIKSDYVTKLAPECSADEVFIKADYGNHSGYDIVVIGIAGRLESPSVGALLIGGITFRFGYASDIASFYAYKDGEFIPVKDAFDNGLLSKSDIYNIAVEKGDIKVPIYREIYSGGGITMTFEETTATLYISGEGRTDDYDPTYVVGGLGLENYSPVGLNSSIKRVVVEEGITYLGEFLFCQCNGIESVQLPSTLEEIGDYCFDRCTNITHVIFPEGIKRIGNFCFENKNLSTLTFYGNAPKTKEYSVLKYFDGTVYYPEDNSTWTKEFMSKYNPDITWEAWSAPKIKDVSNKFEDVSKNTWYTEGIQFCYDKDVVAGMTPSSFAPNGTLTRAQFVQMLAMYDGVDLTDYKSSAYNDPWNQPSYKFTDVRPDAWYIPALNWATEKKIVMGMTLTSFDPNAPVTREHVATFFYSYTRFKGGYNMNVSADFSVFEDAPKSNHWSYTVMQWAVGSGLISGTSRTTLSPRLVATRAQACRMIMNLDAYFEGSEIEDIKYKDGAFKILKEYIKENGKLGGGYWPNSYLYTETVGESHFCAEYFPSSDHIELQYCNGTYDEFAITGAHAMCIEQMTLYLTGLSDSYSFYYGYDGLCGLGGISVFTRGRMSVDSYEKTEHDYSRLVGTEILSTEEDGVLSIQMLETAMSEMNGFIDHLLTECGLKYSDMFLT